MTPTEIFRRMLSSIAFRLALALEEAPPDFAAYQTEAGVMTPLDMVRHMVKVAEAMEQRLGAEAHPREFGDGLEEGAKALYAVLAAIDARVQDTMPPSEELGMLLQGPLSDLLHHVGQLSLLRRLAGSPVRKVSFPRVTIAPGAFPPALPPRV